MAVNEYFQVDGLGVNNKNESDLILLINDTLNWVTDDEKQHLEHLQNKINAYVEYIRGEQYKHVYPNGEFNEFTIDIHMNSYPTELAIKFFDMVNGDLEKENIKVIVAIDESSQEEPTSCGWGF